MQPTMTQSFDSIWQVQKKEITNERLHATARIWETRFRARACERTCWLTERAGWQRVLKLDYSGAAVIKVLA